MEHGVVQPVKVLVRAEERAAAGQGWGVQVPLGPLEASHSTPPSHRTSYVPLHLRRTTGSDGVQHEHGVGNVPVLGVLGQPVAG